MASCFIYSAYIFLLEYLNKIPGIMLLHPEILHFVSFTDKD